MPPVIDLPAELLINILQDVPARDIQLCRAVCRRFRDLIDDNINALAERVHTREHARLTAFIKYHFGYDIKELSFPDALRRWFSRRPIHLQHTHSLVNFGSQVAYATQAARAYPGTSASAMHHPLSLVAQQMIEAHVKLHWRAGCPETQDQLKESIRTYFDFGRGNYLAPLVDDGTLQFAECWDAVLDTENPLVPRILRLQEFLAEIRCLHIVSPLDLWKVTGIHEAFLCCHTAAAHEHVAQTRPRCLGFCSAELLSAILGAPPLPHSAEAFGKLDAEGWVAYCVESPWAYQAVQQVLLGDGTPLQVAGVMEELFIY